MKFRLEYHQLLDLLELDQTKELNQQIVQQYEDFVQKAEPKAVFVITNSILGKFKFNSACPITLLIARHLPKLLDFCSKKIVDEIGLSIYHYFLVNLFKFKDIHYPMSEFLGSAIADNDKIKIGLQYIRSCFGLNVDLAHINNFANSKTFNEDFRVLNQMVIVYANAQLNEPIPIPPRLLKTMVDVWHITYVIKSEPFKNVDDWGIIFPFLFNQFHHSMYFSQFTSVLLLKYFYQMASSVDDPKLLQSLSATNHLVSNDFAFCQFLELDWLTVYKTDSCQSQTIAIFCSVSILHLKEKNTSSEVILCKLSLLIPLVYSNEAIWKPCLSLINEVLLLAKKTMIALDYTTLGFNCLQKTQEINTAIENTNYLELDRLIYYFVQFCSLVSIISTQNESLILMQLISIPMLLENIIELGKKMLPNISSLEPNKQLYFEEQLIALRASAVYLKVIIIRSPHFVKAGNAMLDRVVPLNIYSCPEAIQRIFSKNREYLTNEHAVVTDGPKESMAAAVIDFRTYSDLYHLYILCLDLKTTFQFRRIAIKDYKLVVNIWDEMFVLLTLPIIKQSSIKIGQHLLYVILDTVLTLMEYCGDTDFLHLLMDPPFVERAFKSLFLFWRGKYTGKLFKKMIEFSIPWAAKLKIDGEEYELDEEIVQVWLYCR
ncbi:hypothetical protein HDV01_002970 [Terramyces sp. JEL0728]|nr:hypothetical protein HDV01_002970 [Terramyces sp. JEL0728]